MSLHYYLLLNLLFVKLFYIWNMINEQQVDKLIKFTQ